jgi:O-antigen ligase
MLSKLIRSLYYSLFFVVPLVVFSNTSELFEFNKMNYIYVVAILVGALWVVDMLRRRRILLANTPFDIGLGVFILAHVVSFLFSIDKHVSLAGYYGRLNGGIISLIAYVVLAYAALIYLKKEHVLRLLKISLGAACAVVLIGLPGWFGHDTLCMLLTHISSNSCWTAQFRPAERMFSTIGQPNWLAAYLSANVVVALSYGAYLVKKMPENVSFPRTKGILLVVLSTLLITGVLMTRSRSGLIALIVGLILLTVSFYGMFGKIHLKRTKSYLFALLISLIVVVLVFKTGVTKIDSFLRFSAPQKQAQTATQSPTTNAPSTITDSFTIRTIVWQGAAELIKQYPFTGRGVETFAYAYPQVRPLAHNGTSEWDFVYNKAHNEYLNYGATIGLGGLVGYIWFQGAILWLGYKLYKRYKIMPQKLGKKESRDAYDTVPLAAGLTIAVVTVAITNAVGFSTSTVQLILYLFPMFLLILFDRVDEVGVDDEPPFEFKKNKYAYVGLVVVVVFSLTTLVNSYLADMLYAQGNTYLDANDPQQAVTYFSRAVDLNPTEHVYHDKLGGALAQLALAASLTPTAASHAASLVPLSEKYEQNAIDASPNNATYYRNYGKNELLIFQITGDQKHLQSSLEEFTKSVQLAPTDPRPLYSQCVTYSLISSENPKIEKEYQDKSVQCIDRVIALKRDYFDAYVLKGQFLRSYGQKDAFTAWVEKTKKQFPRISPTDIESEMGIVAK